SFEASKAPPESGRLESQGAYTMTFLEAAVGLLKQERKPLHYSKICELAVKRDLLDHVGGDPEAAMQTALAHASKKGHPHLRVRVKPGVFGLRHYPPPSATAAAESPKAKKADGQSTREAAPKGEKREKGKTRGRTKAGSRKKADAQAAPSKVSKE